MSAGEEQAPEEEGQEQTPLPACNSTGNASGFRAPERVVLGDFYTPCGLCFPDGEDVDGSTEVVVARGAGTSKFHRKRGDEESENEEENSADVEPRDPAQLTFADVVE
jgi:hypothetical protein